MEAPELATAANGVTLPDAIAGFAGLDLNAAEFGKGATYLGIGVIVGLLAKKYLKLVITSVIIATLLLKGLEYRDIIVVDWEAFKNFLGLEATATFETVANAGFEWAKQQGFAAIASFVGFLIGYRAG